ncbi:MAG: endonuclease/exonuclease/phosphatase family protein [Neisseria sp.]
MSIPSPLIVATYNMHKGMSALNRKIQVGGMAEALHSLQPDVLFLQEVQGENLRRQLKRPAFPKMPHYDLISDHLSFHSSYGQNATYKEKHHGNAILSHLPIDTHHNLDISVNKLEQRGVLHCEIQPIDWPFPLVCLCAHLNLREPDRMRQYQAIFEYITNHVNPLSPLIIAGDFNDWRHKSCLNLGQALDLSEVFAGNGNKRPKTFPSRLPLLSLDRIYTRNLTVLDAQVHKEKQWQQLSDHLPLSAIVVPNL